MTRWSELNFVSDRTARSEVAATGKALYLNVTLLVLETAAKTFNLYKYTVFDTLEIFQFFCKTAYGRAATSVTARLLSDPFSRLAGGAA
jgi:hypothetical protein